MSKIFPVESVINGQPTFTEPLASILSHLSEGGAISVLTPLEHHTDRQRRWIKGVCLRGLSEWSGETAEWWDRELKKQCFGAELLKRDTWLAENGQPVTRLTIKGVGKRNLTKFIENILSKAIEMGWPVSPPDSELRK